ANPRRVLGARFRSPGPALPPLSAHGSLSRPRWTARQPPLRARVRLALPSTPTDPTPPNPMRASQRGDRRPPELRRWPELPGPRCCLRRKLGIFPTPRSLSVFGGHDGGLQRIHRLLRCDRTDRHCAFVEAPFSSVAVVTADAQDDGALLLHRDIAGFFRTYAVVHRLQGAGGCVTAVDREAALAAVLVFGVAQKDPRHEVVLEGHVGGNVFVLFVFPAGVQTVFEICHHPRSGFAAGASPPNDAAAKIERFHRAVAVVVGGRFGVAVVETTAVLEVLLASHPVHGFGVVAFDHPVSGLDVATGAARAIADARFDQNAVGRVPVDLHLEGIGIRRAVGSRLGAAFGCGFEIVLLSGLVVDLGHRAGCAGAKGVVGGNVRVAIFGTDVLCRAFAGTRAGCGGPFAQLIQWARVAGDDDSNGAMCGDAGIAPVLQHVAGQGQAWGAAAAAAARPD